MKNCRFLFSLPMMLVAVVLALAAMPARAQVYQGKPKLIVLVVIDQFRGDYLARDRQKFQGHGFRLFTEEGAWFTDCYYDYANTKTAPGHATLGTGAYSDGHGIDSNEFWDAAHSEEHPVSSVEDERYRLVDLPDELMPANQPGAPADALKYLIGSSPRNLRATTLGDELRLATQGRAKVFGVSLKDRAAILPAGQAANGAFWMEPSTGIFTTSTYYMQHLPEWATAFNKSGEREKVAEEAMVPGTTQFTELVGRMPVTNRYELDFAKALIEGEKLGNRGVTDMLVVSLSPNDIQGHQFGPDSDSEEQMILSLDKDLDSFFGWLDKKVGLDNVWLALSADHGVAPVPAEAAEKGIHSGTIKMKELFEKLNLGLNAKFTPGKKVDYFLGSQEMPYLVLDKKAFAKAGVDEKKAEDAVAELLPEAVNAQNPKADTLPLEERQKPGIQFHSAYTKLDMARGAVPQTELGREIGHSYVDHGNWFVFLVLGGYQMQNYRGNLGTTHFSPWSYDRHVPLGIHGAPFVAGEYHGRVAPVDLAATFASLAGVNWPSAAVGRVLTEALKEPLHPTAPTSSK